jgi:uncharacterized membrane protein
MLTLKDLSVAIVFLWFTIGGIAHFAMPDSFARIVPPALPYPLTIVYISGVFELAGAIGLLIPRLRPLAGAGLALLTVCVTPANVYMWQHADLFPSVPPVLLLLRLPLQAVLVWLIVWGTDARRLQDGYGKGRVA